MDDQQLKRRKDGAGAMLGASASGHTGNAGFAMVAASRGYLLILRHDRNPDERPQCLRSPAPTHLTPSGSWAKGRWTGDELLARIRVGDASSSTYRHTASIERTKQSLGEDWATYGRGGGLCHLPASARRTFTGCRRTLKGKKAG